MCVCVYVHVYMSVYTVRTRVCTFVSVCVRACVYSYVCMCELICVYMSACVCACVGVYIYESILYGTCVGARGLDACVCAHTSRV